MKSSFIFKQICILFQKKKLLQELYATTADKMYSKNLISVSIIIVCIYTWSAGAVGVPIPTAFKYVFNSTQKFQYTSYLHCIPMYLHPTHVLHRR